MTFCTWDEYKKSLINHPNLLKTFELDNHPEETERSNMDKYICFCKECREAIEETEEAWRYGEID